ncbi:isocitrate lyase/phosphoenolpyruvate mutase family protein [Lentibacillus sp. N15]|uniref:isocitrate lyase/PEP mutase family protein n=1 Tax=Lentibacillus songyuanensis TaxID=3136161 RepID=UPI0031B9C00F
MSLGKQSLKAQQFHQLHQRSSTFVLPNAWDVISARVFEECGFEAIGTTSAGISVSLGYTDGQNIPADKMIEVIKSIADSVNIPVTADIEAGYGKTIEEVLETVRKVIDTGAVGINIEDGTGDHSQPLYDLFYQKERIAAIRELSNDTKDTSIFINARTDTYWFNIGDASTRLHETIKRAKAFEDAGADCIFVPGLHDPKIISHLREEISSPINLLASPKMPSFAELASFGIKRLSCGSGPFRATVTLLKTISEEITNQRSFRHMMDDVMPYSKVVDLMK